MNLLELFVKVSVDRKGVDRALRDTERRAQQTEDAGQDIGKGFAKGAAVSRKALGGVADSIQQTRNEARKGAKFTVTGDLDDSALKSDLANLKRSLAGADSTINVDVAADTAAATSSMNQWRAAQSGHTIDQNLDVDTAGASAEMASWRARQQGEEIEQNVDVDTAGATAKLTAFRALAGSVGGAIGSVGQGISSGAVGFTALAAAATLAAAALGPLLGALAAVGGLAAGAGAGIGLIAAPIAMVVSKLTAYHEGLEATKSAQGTASSSAQAYKDAMQGVADAQRGVADAQRNVGTVTQQVAQQITDAERAVSDARREAGYAAQAAAQQVEDAEQGLLDARVDLAMATEELADAQQELNDAEEMEPLNQEQATLDLAEARDRASDAQHEYNRAVAEFGANSEEATDAARALDQAQLDLQETEIMTQRTRERGSDQLNAAKEGMTGAYTGMSDAAWGVKDAEEALQQARQDGARSVADAQRAVSEAERGLAQAQQQGAQQIADAQRQVADAQRAVARAEEAAAQAAAKAAEDQNALRDATVAISPAMLGLYNAVMKFKGAAEQAFLPAMNIAARLGTTIIGVATNALPFLGRTATGAMGALSKGMRGVIDLFSQPMQTQSLRTIFASAEPIIARLVPAIGNIAAALTNMLAAAAPAGIALAGAILRISEGILRWSQSEGAVGWIKTAIQSAIPVFSALWDMIVRVGGALIQMGTGKGQGVATAIRWITDALVIAIHTFSAFLDLLGPTGIAIIALVPVFAGLALVVGTIVGILTPLAPIFMGIAGVVSGPVLLAVGAFALAAFLIVKNWGKIKPILQPLINIVKNLWTVMTGGSKEAMAAWGQLPGWVQKAWLAFIVFKAKVTMAIKGAANAIKTALGPALKFAQHLGEIFVKWWRANLPLIQRAASAVFNRIKAVVGGAMRAVSAVIKAVWGAITKNWKKDNGALRTIVTQVWKAIKTVIKTALKVLLQVIKLGLQVISGDWRGAWNTIKKIVQTVWKGITNFLKAGGKAIAAILKGAWNLIKAAASAAWKAFASLISKIVDALIKRMKQRWEDFKRGLDTIWKNVKEAAGKAWNSFSDAVWKIINSLADRIKQRWEDLRRGLSTLWDSIKETANNVWQSISEMIWKPIESAVEKVRNFIDDLKGIIGNAFSALGISGGGKGDTKGNTEDFTSTSNARGGAWKGKAGRQRPHRMARGGVINQPAIGGFASGSTPHAVYGEAGKREYFIVPERADNLPYLQAAANEMGYGLRRRQGYQEENRRHGPPRRAYGRARGHDRYSSGSGTPGGQSHHNVTPEIHAEAERIAAGTGTYWNSYPGHGELGGSIETYTADFWGSPYMDSISSSMGYKTADMALSGGIPVLYIIRQGEYWRDGQWGSNTYGPPHYDHTHVSWDSPGGDTPSGGGTSTVDPATRLQPVWDRLIKPLVEKYVQPLKDSPNKLVQIAGGVGMHIANGLWDSLISKIPGSGGSLPGGNSPKGLTIGEALAQGGWPESQHITGSSTIWHESTGDASAQNPSGAAGLMQIMPNTASGVGADPSKLFDPVYNTSTGYKVYQAAGNSWSPWVGAGMGGDYRDEPVTGYRLGGLIQREHRGTVHPNEMVLPLDRPMVMRSAQAALGTEELSSEISSLRATLVNEGIHVNDLGEPAAQKILVSGEGGALRVIRSESGRRAVESAGRENSSRKRIAGAR